ncbi:Eco57I restriction-modification methylase domain-containing protein [Parafrigoribacterium humi]|uniref:Eco57I restriction-modification methylase domain-containing protein n=1 Tax=Parafrigoribacterium humi TaxID=3144664 RepID=UPI0032EFE640
MTSPTLQIGHNGGSQVFGGTYGHEEKRRGAIFTKQSVVDFMLDLIGYDASDALYERSLLEPSFGGGRFLLSAIERLVESWKSGSSNADYKVLLNAIRAVELDTPTFTSFKRQLRERLRQFGFSEFESAHLADTWLINADYLWTKFDQHFDYVIGNPPYVRQELIDPDQLIAYRAEFHSMIGRADLYVPFIEKSLDALSPNGKLSFICADAWVKNEYGRALRAKIGAGFNLRDYVDMYGVEAFEVGVGAYPSITVIENKAPGSSRVAKAESADRTYLTGLLRDIIAPDGPTRSAAVQQIDRVANGTAPWLLSITHQLPIIRHMESRFPTLGEAGCRIGIGVATGNDEAFIAPLDQLDVEDDRKLPLATNKDVPNGQLQWTGKGIVNPYTDEGPLVDLAQYPRLAAHLESYRAALEKRHTAKANVASRWYKTIDRITPSLTWEEKLLIPDIKGDGDAIAYDPGTLYPHHNLYFITSTKWNLRALQAVLRSGIAHLFVEAYSVKIGGGYLRFQAQNLKRIRVPEWGSLSGDVQAELIDAGESGRKLETTLLEQMYKLNDGDLGFLGGTN